QFPSQGSYAVCLTINDSLGCNFQVCDSAIIQQPLPTVSAYLWVDSLYWNACTAPQNVQLYYSGYTSGYSVNDSAKVEINYGDGVDSIFYLTIANNGFQGNFYHSYLNAGTYNPCLTITGPDQTADTSVFQSIIISSSCGNI